MHARRWTRLALAVLLPALALSPVVAADRAKAERALKESLVAGNADGVQAACDELIEVGGDKAGGAILALLPRLEGAFYWQLIGAASGFRDAPALGALGKFIVAQQSNAKSTLARDLLFGLQNNGSAAATGPLGLVLEKGNLDLKLMVTDQLALIRSVASVDVLVAAARREERGDPELRRRIENALGLLTGESLGDAANWEGWWKEQRAKGLPERKGGDAAGKTMQKPRDNEFHGTVERLAKDRYVVLEGSYDEIAEILEKRKIPHTVVKKADFDRDPAKFLSKAWAILVNCDDCYEGKPPGVPDSGGKRLSEKTLQALKRWVETDGGYLFTEDWGLIDITGVLWSDRIATLDGAAVPPMTGTTEVKLLPVKGSTSHPLMRGVWQKPRRVEAAKESDGGGTREKVESPARALDHRWKIDDLSAPIKVVDAARTTVLLESEELAKAENGTATVAVTFRVGSYAPKRAATGAGAKTTTGGESPKGGRVLHTISHYGHQSSDQDGAALENLLVNFLLEAAQRHE